MALKSIKSRGKNSEEEQRNTDGTGLAGPRRREKRQSTRGRS